LDQGKSLQSLYFALDAEQGTLTWKVNIAQRCPIGTIAGNLDSNGYMKVRVLGKHHMQHRLIFAMVNGYFPAQVDHKDRNKTNNRPANLREATHGQNIQNQNLRRNNTSGIIGVCWVARQRQWKAKIRVNGTEKHLGFFDHKEDAAVVRRNAELFYYGEFAPTENPIVHHAT